MTDGIDWLRYIFAFIFVIGLLYSIGYAARYAGLGSIPLRKPGDKRRLAIVEILPVDAKRKLMIVRCDETEHLVLTGEPNNLIIQSTGAKPAATEKSGKKQ